MSELSERIGTAAGNAFKSGFNCGEAILLRRLAAAWGTRELFAVRWLAR